MSGRRVNGWHMAKIGIQIGGRTFQVACQDGEEQYLQAAAKMLDNVASVIADQVGRMPESRMLLMAGLMLADKTASMEDKMRQLEDSSVSSVSNDPQPTKEGSTISRIKQNRLPILFVSEMVLDLITEAREKLRSDNKLDPEDREAAFAELDALSELARESQALPEALPKDASEYEIEKVEEATQRWSKKFNSALRENSKNKIDPESVASVAVPTSIILGCGALGALIAGPVGLGAGSVVGHLVTGQLKPGAAASKVEESLSEDRDEVH